MDHRLDVAIARRHEDDARAAAAGEDPLHESRGAERLVVGVRRDDDEPLVRTDVERARRLARGGACRDEDREREKPGRRHERPEETRARDGAATATACSPRR